jgi:hypothetical protein
VKRVIGHTREKAWGPEEVRAESREQSGREIEIGLGRLCIGDHVLA